MIDHILVVAFYVHGAHGRVAAVTIAIIGVIGRIRFVDLSFFVVGCNGFDVCHRAISQLKRVSVENFMKWLRFKEVLINEIKKALSYICFDIFAERLIVPKNVHSPYLVVQVYELITCVRRANENARNLISVVQFLIYFFSLQFTYIRLLFYVLILFNSFLLFVMIMSSLQDRTRSLH